MFAQRSVFLLRSGFIYHHTQQRTKIVCNKFAIKTHFRKLDAEIFYYCSSTHKCMGQWNACNIWLFYKTNLIWFHSIVCGNPNSENSERNIGKESQAADEKSQKVCAKSIYQSSKPTFSTQ